MLDVNPSGTAILEPLLTTIPRPSDERPLEHLVVVAGAPASGKSTFLSQLAQRRLQNDILALLPAEAEAWPQVLAMDYRDWLPPLATPSSPGFVPRLVLHYDIFRMTRLFDGQYDPAADPVLGVCGEAKTLTVVTVRPRDGRLIRQYQSRAIGIPDQLGWRLCFASEAAPAYLANALSRATVRYLLGDLDPPPHVRQVLAHYADGDFVARLYERWGALIRRVSTGAPLRLIEIAPGRWRANGDDVDWRVNSIHNIA